MHLKSLVGFSKMLFRFIKKIYTIDRPQGVLSEGQIGDILKLCESPTIVDVQKYCEQVHYKANNIRSDIKGDILAIEREASRGGSSRPDATLPDADRIISNFYAAHSRVVQYLLDCSEYEVSDSLIGTLSSLCSYGQDQFLEYFLEKYEERLSAEDVFKILQKISHAEFMHPISVERHKFLFERLTKRLAFEEIEGITSRLNESSIRQLSQTVEDVHSAMADLS